jgi:hypothetical protein
MKDGVLMEPLFEKADDFLQLTLDFVVIVLEPFSGRVIGVVELDLKDVCALINPKGVDNTELVAHIVDKFVLSLTGTDVIHSFVVRASGCRVAGPLALRPVCGPLPMVAIGVVIVVGDVSEFATKSLIFLAERVLLSLVLSGNLRNVITSFTRIMIMKSLTLISASLLASRLRGGVFSSSDGDREREGQCVRFVVCGIRVEREMDLRCGATSRL